MAHDQPSRVVVRSIPPSQSDYSGYRDYLRHDFYYACAYCCVSEREFQKFEIDHYIPRKAAERGWYHGDLDSYQNLMWSCEWCNRKKTDSGFFDTDMIGDGLRFLRPDCDDPRDHVEIVTQNGAVKPKSEVGRVTIEILELNAFVPTQFRKARLAELSNRKYALDGLRALNAIRVHELPSKLRSKFRKLKRDFEREFSYRFDQDLRNLNRSFVLDLHSEDENLGSTKRRRECLDDLKVKYPESVVYARNLEENDDR